MNIAKTDIPVKIKVPRIIGLFIMFAIFTSVVLVTNPAQAFFVQSFNCGGGGTQPIIAGDNEEAVLMKCGHPNSTEGNAWVYYKGVDTTIAVIYDGSTPFRRNVLGIEIKIKPSY
jgi:hypothetical protein